MPNLNLPQWAGIAAFVSMTAVTYAEGPIMRDAATHEQLAQAQRQAGQSEPKKILTVPKGEDPSVVNRPQDLLSQSDILCLNGMATLVPKRAILQIPEACSARLKIEPGAKIVSWAEFYAANRGWITTIEISRTQAEGNEPIAEDTQTMMTKCRNLIVATFQGGPISLLPAKPPAEPAATAQP
jgi:hypothetical protein